MLSILFVLLVESFLSRVFNVVNFICFVSGVIPVKVMRSHSCHGFLYNVGLCSHSYQIFYSFFINNVGLAESLLSVKKIKLKKCWTSGFVPVNGG